MKRWGFPKSLLGIFRRSLQARAVAFTILLSGFALVAVGGFLSFSIGNGLFQTRLNQVLSESERSVVQVQNTFAAANVADEVSLQSVMNSVVPNLESNGGNLDRKVALLRTVGQPATTLVLQSPISATLDVSVITDDFRQRTVNADGSLVYQSVELKVDQVTHPGLVVGAPIQIPLAGAYELYLVFDLQNEQQTLDFVQQTLIIGGAILIVMIGMVSFFVTNWMVKPVMVAAEASEQLASGQLDRRLPERGDDVLATLARSFNRMAETLQKQLTKLTTVSTMQQRFVSDVSHELRTPLTTIKIAGDLIFSNRDKLDEELQRPAEILHNQIVRFEKLLNDLLEISRYDAGAVSAEMEVQDIQGVVGMAIASIEPLAASKGSRINIQLPEQLVEAEFDSRRIERLLRNLLANAVEHGEGKPIDVAVAADDRAVAISVTDHGVGMTKAQLDRVFDRFWRADPARKRTTGGTGLGLAISQEDANLHNGWLQVWARPNRGASFRLTIPRVKGTVFSVSPLPLPPGEVTDATTEIQL